MPDLFSLFHDQRLFRCVVEASPAGMVIVDDAGVIVMTNPAATKQFGYGPNEFLGMAIDQLVPVTQRPVHRAHRARYMAQPEHRPMATSQNLFARRKDGSTFPVDISLHPIEIDGRRMVLANVLDASDRQRAEQERERRQVMERLAVLGQLAGGMAHEIRTPLCVIRNDAYYLEMIKDRLGEEGQQCIAEINTAVAKAERIVSELLDFTRDPACEPRATPVAKLIDGAIRSIQLPDSITVQRQGNEHLVALVDPDQIERVLINLIRNAIDAMHGEGTLDVNVVQASPGQHAVIVEVIDDGQGIEDQDLERVFEPLYSTKPKGTGLGLAVSKRYAERNGGSLTAIPRAELGGACFRLTIPMAEKEVE